MEHRSDEEPFTTATALDMNAVTGEEAARMMSDAPWVERAEFKNGAVLVTPVDPTMRETRMSVVGAWLTASSAEPPDASPTPDAPTSESFDPSPPGRSGACS